MVYVRIMQGLHDFSQFKNDCFSKQFSPLNRG